MAKAHATEAQKEDRETLEQLLANLENAERAFAMASEEQQQLLNDYRHAIDALHAEALRRLIAALKGQPAALGALKDVASDAVVYAVLRHHGLLKPSLNERVEGALESVRPILASHGGNVRLVNVAPPRIEVQFTGACDGCSASTLTFHAGVKKAVQDACPEITEIVQVQRPIGSTADTRGMVSPFSVISQGAWHSVCDLSEIPEGGLRSAGIANGLLLFRRGRIVTCFKNACAHLGFPLHNGDVREGILTCPEHAFRYDLRTGVCLTVPDLRLQSVGVRIMGDRVEVNLSP